MNEQAKLFRLFFSFRFRRGLILSHVRKLRTSIRIRPLGRLMRYLLIRANMEAEARNRHALGLLPRALGFGMTCIYYPGSDRIAWFRRGDTNITRALTVTMVMSIINSKLAAKQGKV